MPSLIALTQRLRQNRAQHSLHLHILSKSAAFREEYRIKRLSKLIKEKLVDGGRFKKKSPGEER
jgi:predicted GIY-YIG superfamily endonuclease